MLDYIINNYYLASFLVLLATVFAFLMQMNVSSTFKKYNKKPSSAGMSASQVARQILDSNGLYDVQVVRTSGSLSDYYDPKSQVVALSDSTYASSSIGAIGVAAHECGHAVQHSENYIPVRLRQAIFPVVNIASRSWLYMFLFGLAFSFPLLTELGIVFFGVVVVFQFITLPVEFNASKRAMDTINSQGLLSQSEQGGARKVLSAAAMTYVASLLVAITQLLRLIAQSNRRRR